MLYKGFSKNFWLMCLASLFFFASFNMIIPELPKMLRSLGGIKYLGWNIAAFSLIALLSRPLSGLLTDKIGRIPVMVFGTMIAVFIGFIYPFVSSIMLYFVLRGVHGLAAGFTPTANVAFIDDVIPQNRKGEAMGMVGVANVVGMSSGPPIGSWIANTYGLDYTFFASSSVALLALLIFLTLKETIPVKEKLSYKLFTKENLKFFAPKAIPPSFVMMLTVFSFGTLLTLAPDYAVFHGFTNKGSFFTYMVVASLLSRVVAGKKSDTMGRRKLASMGCFILTIGMVIMAVANSSFIVIVGACTIGFGQGFLSPILFAWAVGVADPKNKSRAISTIFIALEIGVIAGSLIPGFIYNDKIENFPLAFAFAASINAIALFYLVLNKNLKES